MPQMSFYHSKTEKIIILSLKQRFSACGRGNHKGKLLEVGRERRLGACSHAYGWSELAVEFHLLNDSAYAPSIRTFNISSSKYIYLEIYYWNKLKPDGFTQLTVSTKTFIRFRNNAQRALNRILCYTNKASICERKCASFHMRHMSPGMARAHQKVDVNKKRPFIYE